MEGKIYTQKEVDKIREDHNQMLEWKEELHRGDIEGYEKIVRAWRKIAIGSFGGFIGSLIAYFL